MKCRITAGILSAASLALTACGLSGPASLTSQASGTLTARSTLAGIQVKHTMSGAEWQRIECLEDTNPQFPDEQMRPNGRQRNPEIVQAFGTDTPPVRDVLLHYYPGWDHPDTLPPVLLLHGTVVDANNCWLQPFGKTGLARALAAKGRRVFAVTFANRHGDNNLQAQNVNDAIARIREVTGATQVDLVGHSKGNMAARVLTSNVRYPWMTPFRGDVHHVIMLGAPLLGLDFTFRHSVIGFGLYPEKDETVYNAPIAWTKMLLYGSWVDSSKASIYTSYGNFFPGQTQMVYRWDKEYPLAPTNPDWYTTYNGGQGLVSSSDGIDQAIAQGGHYIDMLRAHPIDSRVAFSVAAGDQANVEGILNETDGPSDGVVFLKSATATNDLTKGGAKMLAREVMHVNHMGLITDPAVQAWVNSQL